MSKKRTYIRFIEFAILFAVIAVVVGVAYERGIHRPPLVFANIPLNTRTFIEQLGADSYDQGVKFLEQGPFDWENKKDDGARNDGWRAESNENFIVYYQPDGDALWQGRAQDVLAQAQRNIIPLKDLMGRYYYPHDMNGRRLPIYLPVSVEQYLSLITSLLGEPSQGAEISIGITITAIGPLGCLTKGIVLSPVCFDDSPDGPNGYCTTLRHEMCHYVFFSSLDYSKEIHHYLWVSEGIAEYFGNRDNHRPVTGSDSIDLIKMRCRLDREFPLEGNAAYWAGESFFGYLEAKGGKDEVKSFIDDAYRYSTDSIFIRKNRNPRLDHHEWVKTLERIDSVARARQQEMS